ncbi:MAG: head GIN domain-containing protein [Myxococcota bacterium]
MATAAIIGFLVVGAAATQTVSPFNAIQNSGPVDIEVRVDPDANRAYEIELDAPDKIRDLVLLDVANETLSVEYKKQRWGSWSTNDKAVLRVTVKQLTKVVLRGSGDLRVEGKQGGPLALSSSGSGNADIGGETGDLQVVIRGSGDIRVEELNADSVQVDIKGSGDLDLAGRATDVSIQVYGSGDVDGGRLEARDAEIKVNGSGDITICASGDVRRQAHGSGDIVVDCD